MNIGMAGFCLATFTVGALGQITGSGTTNQVAKFTGATAVGNSAITEANGNVGIGTTTPGTPLNVVANPTATIPQIRISPIGMTGSSTSLPSYLDFYSTFDAYPSDQGPRRTATIKALYSGGVWGNEALAFEVGTGGVNDAANELTERMRIAGNGNVGIGTSSPSQKLEVNGWILADGTVTANGLQTTGTLSSQNSGTNTEVFLWSDNNIAYMEAHNFANNVKLPLAFNAWGGNVGIGTTTPGQKLEVAGNAKFDGSLIFSDGTTQTTAWTGALCGGDYAESVGVSGERAQYEPGDVLVIDPANPENFLKSSVPYSTTVAGIYSTKPGVTGRRTADPQKVQAEIPMAMVGIVPTRVTAENGPIRVGDLLVTSSAPGYAMKGIDREQMLGAVLGKALGPLSSGTGVINVLVTLQ